MRILGYYNPDQKAKSENIILDLFNKSIDVKDIDAQIVQAAELDLPPEVLSAIKSIRSQDKSFDTEKFLTGAKKAYTMLVQAIENSDNETLSYLADDEIISKITTQADSSKRNELLEISSIKLFDAVLYGDRAVLSVEITGTAITQTKDLNGNLLSGLEQPSTKSVKVVFARYLAQENIWKIIKIY
jgi:predicted lipid-binding transport protein (Tim44 family)